MSKQTMIEAIQQHNPSAPSEFLVHFDEVVLRSYLDRLERLAGHRGQDSRWVRDGSTHSIVTRARREHAA